MEAARARLGSLVEWAVAALFLVASVGVASLAMRELRATASVSSPVPAFTAAAPAGLTDRAVSVVYASGAIEDHLVKLSQGSTFVQLPASGPVRGVELNRDDQALIVVERGPAPRTRNGDPMSSSKSVPQLKRSN